MTTTTAAAGASAMAGPFAVALKHSVTPSPVHVKMREERTAGGACCLRLLCSITTSYELQMIGGPGLQVGEQEEHTDHVRALHDVDLRSHDACRAAILELFSSLRVAAGPVSLLDPAAGDWYEPVLAAAADGIVSQLQPVTSGEGYAFDVSLCIEESFKYVQPEALLLACEQAEIPPTSQAPVVERCAVCMERLPLPSLTPTTEEPLLALPSCGHTFHRRCIASWFQKGSTCPLCRRDMMYCLFDAEKRFGLEREDISSNKRKRD